MIATCESLSRDGRSTLVEDYLAENPRGPGFHAMTPQLCQHARKTVTLTQRQLAEEIGESLETVFRYEMGKPTDEAVARKLIDYFNGYPIRFDRSGRLRFVVRHGSYEDDDEKD